MKSSHDISFFFLSLTGKILLAIYTCGSALGQTTAALTSCYCFVTPPPHSTTCNGVARQDFLSKGCVLEELRCDVFFFENETVNVGTSSEKGIGTFYKKTLRS